MFDIKKEANFSREERLLYNIWQELVMLNSKQEKQKVEVIPIENENKAKTSYKCKVCGTEHENKGQLLACAKKHKKEEETNDRTRISSTGKGK